MILCCHVEFSVIHTGDASRSGPVPLPMLFLVVLPSPLEFVLALGFLNTKIPLSVFSLDHQTIIQTPQNLPGTQFQVDDIQVHGTHSAAYTILDVEHVHL